MIDAALVTRKMKLISDDLRELMKLSQNTIDQYLADPHTEVLAERYLERVIGRMIDINFHLITESGHAPPSDYYDSFLKLGALGILPPALARHLASAAGLRNRIAHEYDDIDFVKVYEGLRDAARDIPPYLEAVQTKLDSL